MNDQQNVEPVITILYRISFNGEKQLSLPINLDSVDLRYRPLKHKTPPDWTSFDTLACEGCKVKAEQTHCPVAVNFAEFVEAFDSVYSFERVDVSVITQDREYKREDVEFQTVLSSLFGIIMVTSGCKDLDMLRPMVLFHLPFATPSETIYRAVSMYLIAQYFRRKQGLEQDWDLDGLTQIYAKINTINANMTQRLRMIADKDASMNAVTILDVFAQMVPMSLNDDLQELEHLFKQYLK